MDNFQRMDRMFLNILRPLELSVCLMILYSTPNDSSFNEQLSRIFIEVVTKSQITWKISQQTSMALRKETCTTFVPIPTSPKASQTVPDRRFVAVAEPP